MRTLGEGVETNGTQVKFDSIHPSVFSLPVQRKDSSPQGEPWPCRAYVGNGLPDGPNRSSTDRRTPNASPGEKLPQCAHWG